MHFLHHLVIALRKPQVIVPEETSIDKHGETKGHPRTKRMELDNNSKPQALLTKNGSNTSKLLKKIILVSVRKPQNFGWI